MTEEQKRGRGRPPGAKNKKTVEQEQKAAAKAASKSTDGAKSTPHSVNISDDQEHKLLIHHATIVERTENAVKEARKTHNKALKAAADEGITKDDIKLHLELKTPEGEIKHKARVERRFRIMRWNGVPVGVQGELFPKVDRTPLEERAFEAGKRAGMEGKGSEENMHDPNSAAGRKWEAGRQEGVGVALKNGLKQKDDGPDPATPGTQTLIAANRPGAPVVQSNDRVDDDEDMPKNPDAPDPLPGAEAAAAGEAHLRAVADKMAADRAAKKPSTEDEGEDIPENLRRTRPRATPGAPPPNPDFH